jgi:ATP-dependent Clp protease ATP-binding subunit ClpA
LSRSKRTISGVSAPDEWAPDPISVLFIGDRLTAAARDALYAASAEATNLGHSHVGTEHLLLALAADPGSETSAALARSGVAREAVLDALEPIRLTPTVGAPAPRPNSELKSVVERSLREALRAGARFISTDLLLLGMLAERRNFGARVLDSFGVTLAALRDRFGYPASALRTHSEVAYEVVMLRKENTALLAAVHEMRPILDRQVHNTETGGPSARGWARKIRLRIAAGEFGDPRHLI